MIPLVAHDALVAFAAGVAFTIGAMTPIGAVVLAFTLFLRPRKRKPST